MGLKEERARDSSPELRNEVIEHFEELAERYDDYKAASPGYYDQLKKLYSELIDDAEKKKVLEVGCGTGELLAHLNPRYGVGVDISESMIRIAEKKYSDRKNLRFVVGEAENFSCEEYFDYVILADVFEHLYEPERAVQRLSELAGEETELIVSIANHRWTRLLHFLEKIKMKMPEGPHNWIEEPKLIELFIKHGFRITNRGKRTLIPAKIPMAADLINNNFHKIPILKKWGLIVFFTAQKRPE